eukprot:758995-Hanusia_phi.AAC.2
MLRDVQELEEILIVSELRRVYELGSSPSDKSDCGMAGGGEAEQEASDASRGNMVMDDVAFSVLIMILDRRTLQCIHKGKARKIHCKDLEH